MIIFILMLLLHSFAKRQPTDGMWLLGFFVGFAEFISFDKYFIGLV